jgi:hypothetical protein
LGESDGTKEVDLNFLSKLKPEGKKITIAVVAAIAMVVNAVLGHPVDDKTVYAILGLFGTYILGQGIADHGAQGAAKAAERAIAKGADVAAAVQGVLGARAGNKEPLVHDDDGPGWEDTATEDEADRPRELNG